MESDEFAVLMLDRSMEQALQMAEKIRGDIEDSSVDIDGEPVSFTVSIGVAPIAEYCSSVSQVMESARSALRLAKEQGRNRVVQYEEVSEEVITFKKEKTRTLKHLEETLATDVSYCAPSPLCKRLSTTKIPAVITTNCCWG